MFICKNFNSDYMKCLKCKAFNLTDCFLLNKDPENLYEMKARHARELQEKQDNCKHGQYNKYIPPLEQQLYIMIRDGLYKASKEDKSLQIDHLRGEYIEGIVKRMLKELSLKWECKHRGKVIELYV